MNNLSYHEVLPTEIINMKPHIFRNAVFDEIFVFIFVCTHVDGVTFVRCKVEYHDDAQVFF